jgi:DnaJ-class molecular chaperone
MTVQEAVSALGLSGDITKAAIKKQFRQAAHAHHPDKSGSDKQFKKIKDAYDLLVKTPIDTIRSSTARVVPKRSGTAAYDPFTDAEYSQREFYQPDNPNIEGYERKLRAKGCPHCHGLGSITKNTQPDKGFLGLETRLCRCQWQ